MFEVAVNVPHLAKGETIEIDGLGYFVNGKTTEVEDDAVTYFRRKHTEEGKPLRTLKSLFKNVEGIEITSMDNQPTLDEAEEDPGTAEDSSAKEGE